MRRTFWAEYGDSPENKEYFCTRKREMLEWLKRHAWKACIRLKRIGGSNPPLSAKHKRGNNNN